MSCLLSVSRSSLVLRTRSSLLLSCLSFPSFVPLVSLSGCAGVCSSFRRVASLLCSPMALGAVFVCLTVRYFPPACLLSCFVRLVRRYVCVSPSSVGLSFASVCLSCTSACMSYPSVRPSCLSARRFVFVSCAPVRMCACLVRRYVCLFVGLSVRLFVCPVRRSRVCIICPYVCRAPAYVCVPCPVGPFS